MAKEAHEIVHEVLFGGERRFDEWWATDKPDEFVYSDGQVAVRVKAWKVKVPAQSPSMLSEGEPHPFGYRGVKGERVKSEGVSMLLFGMGGLLVFLSFVFLLVVGIVTAPLVGKIFLSGILAALVLIVTGLGVPLAVEAIRDYRWKSKWWWK